MRASTQIHIYTPNTHTLTHAYTQLNNTAILNTICTHSHTLALWILQSCNGMEKVFSHKFLIYLYIIVN